MRHHLKSVNIFNKDQTIVSEINFYYIFPPYHQNMEGKGVFLFFMSNITQISCVILTYSPFMFGLNVALTH